MKKIEIEAVSTEELTPDKVVTINRLKNQYWKHEEEEHMRWFKENIRPNDNHLLIWGVLSARISEYCSC